MLTNDQSIAIAALAELRCLGYVANVRSRVLAIGGNNAWVFYTQCLAKFTNPLNLDLTLYPMYIYKPKLEV